MDELHYIIYDVQHGSCSHLITPANQHILIDLGSKTEKSICRYLKEKYFCFAGTIDELILTHLHEDHLLLRCGSYSATTEVSGSRLPLTRLKNALAQPKLR